MKYTSIPIISAAALSVMGFAASAEALEPQHATAENTPPVLAQIDNPVRLTDSQMAEITAGAADLVPTEITSNASPFAIVGRPVTQGQRMKGYSPIFRTARQV